MSLARNFSRFVALVLVLLSARLTHAAEILPQRLAGSYRLHLYFGDTKPFLDDVRLDVSPAGAITGLMHVPGDFDAKVEAAALSGTRLTFEILVPKNASRPVDLVFRYEAEIFREDPSHLAGFASIVRSDGKPVAPGAYVASFLMFRKKP